MHQRAFTLVELSIVLVIVGLVTGGIMVGSSVMRSAELQTIGKDFKKYEGVVMAFTEQYGGMPGDITNATQYWGTDASGCPTNTNFRVRKETCDGNGDGQFASNPETFRAWQQLGAAGLIDSLYAGVAGTGGVLHAIAGVNAPKGKMQNSVYHIQTIGTYTSADNIYFAGVYGTILRFGRQSTTSLPYVGILTPKEAYNIDLKFDDGMPALGNFFQFESISNCHTGSESAAVYDVRKNGKECSMNSITGF